jgi:chromate reductase
VSGSLQSGSGNRTLLETARQLAPALGADVVLFEGLKEIPPFEPGDPEDAPAPVIEWRRALAASDAVLVASPEYGFSLPGTLKNAVDWVIGSGELERKAVALTASVNIAGRGKRGLKALADTLHAVSARIVGPGPIVRGPHFEEEVGALIAALVREVRAPAQAPMHGMGFVRPSGLAEAWIAAFNRGDADALAAMYAEDGAIETFESNAPRTVRGRPAIRAALAQHFVEGAPPRTIAGLFEDGEQAIVEWRNEHGSRGAAFFRVKRSEIVLERRYRA